MLLVDNISTQLYVLHTKAIKSRLLRTFTHIRTAVCLSKLTQPISPCPMNMAFHFLVGSLSSIVVATHIVNINIVHNVIITGMLLFRIEFSSFEGGHVSDFSSYST